MNIEVLMKDKPIILAISAASGFILGLKTLDFLLENNYKVELVISQNAYYIAKHEQSLALSHNANQIKQAIIAHLDKKSKADNLKIWLNDQIWADIASGSHKTLGMVIVPASMSAVASIASGLSDNLIERAADVVIKEGRTLVIVPRETPFSSIHLENMLKLSRLGVRVVPPIAGFYTKDATFEGMVDFVCGKVLDVFGIDNDLYKRWSV